MKKRLKFEGQKLKGLKFNLKMKLTTLIAITSIFYLQAGTYNSSYGQQKLSINKNNVTVSDVIDEIESQSEYQFIFATKSVDLQRKVSIKMNRQYINTVLEKLFKDTNTIFIIDDSKILLKKEGDTAVIKESLKEIKEQQQTITGQVVDEQGVPLPGANILVKGTNNGVSSDFDGNFSLDVSGSNIVLIVSYLGYATKEVAIINDNKLIIKLDLDSSGLDEVIVIGYGSVKKSDLTGSVVSVGEDELSAFPTNSAIQALQGRASGVSITLRNGEPGSGIKISVRGNTSIQASNDPLIVVDGFPGGQLPPPEDIKSIEILKDASSTAIYGSRGANGVLLVTTKTGKTGKSVITVNTSYSSEERIDKIDVLNGTEYAEYINEVDPGFYPDPSSFGQGTNWQDEVFRIGEVQNTQVSVSGGSDKLSYYVSGSLYDKKGIVQNSEFKRYSITSNLQMEASDKLRFGLNLFARGSKLNGTNSQRAPGSSQADVIASAYNFPTTQVIFDSNGGYAAAERGFQIDNPIAVARELSQETLTDLFQINVFAEIDLLKNLKFKSTLGGVVNSSRYGRFYPTTLLRGRTINGEGQLTFRKNRQILTENYLTYSPQISENHQFTILGGTSFQSSSTEASNILATEFPTNANLWWELDAAANVDQVNSLLDKNELYSYYARVNYSFKGKYLLTFSGRHDGSSVLADGNQWQFFPSGAIAWNVKKEKFLSNIDGINNLKLRASYGEVGSQSVDPYESLGRVTSVFTTQGNIVVTALRPDNIGNADLSWEVTTQTNFGIDLGLWNNKFTLTADYYTMDTSGLLFEVLLPGFIGVSSQLRNIGEIQNKGFELSIGSKLVNTEHFSWNLDTNISFNENKIKKLIENNTDGNDIFYGTVPLEGTSGLDSQILREGESVGTFFGFVYDGVLQTGETALPGSHSSDQAPGGRKFKDLNENGELDPGDRTIIGNPNPDFTWGLNNNLTFKNFDFNIFVQGVQGGDILNYTNMELGILNGRTNASRNTINRWSPSNTNTDIPSANVDRVHVVSDRWVEDGSYIRLKNLAVGYSFDDYLLEKINLSSVRIFFSAQNLFTITDYKGVDPEVAYASAGLNGSRNLGLDYATYPNVKSFTLGLSLGF